MSGSCRTGILSAFVAITLISSLACVSPQAGILVAKAWSRETVGSGGAGIVYLTIENRGTHTERIVSLSTPVAAQASVHETVHSGGMVEMNSRPDLEIPPGSHVSFEPGGLHVMLMGLHAPLARGSRFPLTIQFERAGSIQVEVQTGSIGAAGHPDASDANDR
ncbi:MAG: copper chaperone PCu(A)C [bacterium]|nr:copper chaperone PCu(A)C [bacterium]